MGATVRSEPGKAVPLQDGTRFTRVVPWPPVRGGTVPWVRAKKCGNDAAICSARYWPLLGNLDAHDAMSVLVRVC